MAKHPVCSIDELERSPRRVEVDGRAFLVCSIEGEVRAYRNVCPHQHGPVAEGRLGPDGRSVTCPWHGWEFDLADGEGIIRTGIADVLPRANTAVEDGTVYIVE